MTTDPTPDRAAGARADATNHLVPRAVRPIDIEHDELTARAAAEHQARVTADQARAANDRRAVLREAADAAENVAIRLHREHHVERSNGAYDVMNVLAALAREPAAGAEPPLSPDYEHPACGFHWHGKDGMDIPLRDGEPVCPRCELARVEKLLAHREKRCDELRAESKRRGKVKLEYAEKIRLLEREIDGIREQLGAEIPRTGQAEAELRRLADGERDEQQTQQDGAETRGGDPADEYSYQWSQLVLDRGRLVLIPWDNCDGDVTGSVWVHRADVPHLVQQLLDTTAAPVAGQPPADTGEEAREEIECANCWRVVENRSVPNMGGLSRDNWVHVPGGFQPCFPQRGADSPRAEPELTVVPQPETVHGCPPDGSGLTPCCGRTPFELPLTDRISSEAPVTCTTPPAVVAEPGKEN